MKYSIQSKYILYKDQLISGYVCIEGEFIKYILHEPNELLNEYPIKYVYENQVLMAAAIDTNVLIDQFKQMFSQNINQQQFIISLSMWNHIEEFTKQELYTKRLAIVGGTSLIVNKPYQLNLDMDANETYQIQIQQLSLKSQTDFIQMAKIIHKEDVHTQVLYLHRSINQ